MSLFIIILSLYTTADITNFYYDTRHACMLQYYWQMAKLLAKRACHMCVVDT